MDMTAQIKKNLISRIKDSKDLNFLKALQTIFDSSEQALYQLSSEQQTVIEKGKNDIKEGDFYKNEEVISEMREWLKKK
jgi:predicted transcriptional regulator